MSHPQFAAELVAARRSGRDPITIGLAGAGQMGTDIVVQVALMPGMRIGAISEVRPAGCDRRGASGRPRPLRHRHGRHRLGDRPRHRGRQDRGDRGSDALAAAGRIDVIIDATGNPNIGTLFALDVMKNGKHIVMLNVEADITIGRFLKEEARKAGVVYTGAAGDEPACTLEIIGFARSLGFTIVAAGKGKNNPLKFDAVPADYEKEAAERNMNARMLVEFVDGSKTAIEMVAIANATGLVPDVPGMHGPTATLEELADVLCPREDGGVLHRKGVVDYSIGKGVAPGVFCIIETQASARAGAHDRPQGRQGPVLHALPALSSDQPRSAAVGGPRRALQARRHAAARPSRRRGRRGRQARPRPCATVAGHDRRERLSRLRHDLGGRARAKAHCRSASPSGRKVVKPVKSGDFLTYDNCVPDNSMVITQIRRRLDQSDGRFASNAA